MVWGICLNSGYTDYVDFGMCFGFGRGDLAPTLLF